jgi:molybdopterin molybdotransferase
MTKYIATPLISIEHARDFAVSAARRLPTELLPIEEALDRVLADDVHAAGDVPPFACSAMDGYAIIAGSESGPLNVVAESRAGTPSSHQLAPGEAVRISTGAAVPAGATAVVRQEDVRASDGRIEIDAEARVEAGANIRHPGEDMHAGTPVLTPGTRLTAAALGAAVAAGVGTVTVSRRPTVAVLSTGDELRRPGEALGPGEIHNSNAPMLAALATHAGGRTTRPGILPDDAGATEAGLSKALDEADVVLVTGGVSVGPHDHVKPALHRLCVEERFWGVALQPGKPTWFGTRGHQLVFGLPGNPVSTVVTFSLFADPAIQAMLGAPAHDPPAPSARLTTDLRRNRGRTQAIRVRLNAAADKNDDFALEATPNGPQGSHILTSLLGADALALIEPGEGNATAGTRVALAYLST